MAGTAVADDILLQGSEIAQGTFTGFKNSTFLFDRAGVEQREPAVRVRSIVLDPPAKVTLWPKGKRKIENATLRSYSGSRFYYSQGGKDEEIPSMQVNSIEVGLDFARAAAAQPAKPEAPTAAFDVESAVKPGVVTIVHFHIKTAVASIREGNYADALARDSKGKIALVRVEVPDWDTDLVKKYQLTTLPQFWFYDRNGALAVKVTDRFTEQDIDSALKKAKR